MMLALFIAFSGLTGGGAAWMTYGARYFPVWTILAVLLGGVAVNMAVAVWTVPA